MANNREDDPLLSGSVRLWRRIPNWPNATKHDEKLNDLRPSTTNFDDDELSVDIAEETTLAKTLKGNEGFGLVELTAGLAREILGSSVILCRDPLPANPAHALICGKKSRAQRKELAKRCKWILKPGERPKSQGLAILAGFLLLLMATAAVVTYGIIRLG